MFCPKCLSENFHQGEGKQWGGSGYYVAFDCFDCFFTFSIPCSSAPNFSAPKKEESEMESERNEMDIRPFEKEEDEISPPLPDPNADHFETGRVSVAADWYYAVDERIKRLEKRLKERSFTALSEAFTASATIKRLEDWVKRLEKESREKDEKLENAQVAIRSYVAILAKRDATVESQRETIRLLQLAIDDDVLVLLTKKCAELEAKLSREKANAEHARSGMKAARAGRDQAFDKLEKLTNTPEAENLLQALNNSTKNLNEQIAQISRLHDKLRKMRKACSQLNKAVDRKNMRIAQLESKEAGHAPA